ncbi:hypothetical protein M8J77_014645 [Diaphorina citri]|nr:hypothetical protein M8J77_014645 [Diaphorina citri]
MFYSLCETVVLVFLLTNFNVYGSSAVEQDSGCVQCTDPLKSCSRYVEELGEVEHRRAAQLVNTPNGQDQYRCMRSADYARDLGDATRMRISSKIMRLNRIIDEAKKHEKNMADEGSNLIPIKMKDVNRLSLTNIRNRDSSKRSKFKGHGEYKIKDMVSETLSPDVNIQIDAIKDSVTNLKEEPVLLTETDSKTVGEKKGLVEVKDELKETGGESKEKVKEAKGKEKVKLSKDRKLSKKHKSKHKVRDFKRPNALDAESSSDFEDENGEVIAADEIRGDSAMNKDTNEGSNAYPTDSTDKQLGDYVSSSNNEEQPFSDEEQSSDDQLSDLNLKLNRKSPSDPSEESALGDSNNSGDGVENGPDGIETKEVDGLREYGDSDQAYDNVQGGSQDESSLTEAETSNADKSLARPNWNSQVNPPYKIKPCNCECKPPECTTKSTWTTPCTMPCTNKCTTPCTTKSTNTCPTTCPTTNKSLMCCPAKIYICSKPQTTCPSPASCPMCNNAELSEDADKSDETETCEAAPKATEEEKPEKAVEDSNDSNIAVLSKEMQGINNRLEKIIKIIHGQKKSQGLGIDKTVKNDAGEIRKKSLNLDSDKGTNLVEVQKKSLSLDKTQAGVNNEGNKVEVHKAQCLDKNRVNLQDADKADVHKSQSLDKNRVNLQDADKVEVHKSQSLDKNRATLQDADKADVHKSQSLDDEKSKSDGESRVEVEALSNVGELGKGSYKDRHKLEHQREEKKSNSGKNSEAKGDHDKNPEAAAEDQYEHRENFNGLDDGRLRSGDIDDGGKLRTSARENEVEDGPKMSGDG